jgi:peptidoglycan/xylan/chitin deacetylase (PgdA/CDA1 family)
LPAENGPSQRHIYLRRRIAAAAVAALVLIAIAVLVDRETGSRGHASRSAEDAARSDQPRPLAARARESHVKQPRAVEGDGAFMTVAGRTVMLRDVRPSKPMVALTFDDGPDVMTSRLLSKLDRLNVRASFFVIGLNVAERPELVRRANAMGMTIGNHTVTHRSMNRLSARDQRAEIDRMQRVLVETIGRPAYFFRPPGHDWNFTTARTISQAGLVGVRFSIDTQDWRGVPSKEIIDRAMQAKSGDVIQLHDGGPRHAQTLRAVGPIVRRLRKRGFELVTLDELYRSGGGTTSGG